MFGNKLRRVEGISLKDIPIFNPNQTETEDNSIFALGLDKTGKLVRRRLPGFGGSSGGGGGQVPSLQDVVEVGGIITKNDSFINFDITGSVYNIRKVENYTNTQNSNFINITTSSDSFSKQIRTESNNSNSIFLQTSSLFESTFIGGGIFRKIRLSTLGISISSKININYNAIIDVEELTSHKVSTLPDSGGKVLTNKLVELHDYSGNNIPLHLQKSIDGHFVVKDGTTSATVFGVPLSSGSAGFYAKSPDEISSVGFVKIGAGNTSIGIPNIMTGTLPL